MGQEVTAITQSATLWCAPPLAARGAGAALLAAFGGPVGVAISALALGIGYFVLSSHDASAAADELAASVNSQAQEFAHLEKRTAQAAAEHNNLTSSQRKVLTATASLTGEVGLLATAWGRVAAEAKAAAVEQARAAYAKAKQNVTDTQQAYVDKREQVFREQPRPFVERGLGRNLQPSDPQAALRAAESGSGKERALFDRARRNEELARQNLQQIESAPLADYRENAPAAPATKTKKKGEDHSAEQALRDAQQIEGEITAAKIDELRARQDLAKSAADQADFEHQILDLETTQRASDIKADAEQRKKQFPLRARQIDADTQILLSLNDQVDQQRRAQIDRVLEQRLADEALDLKTAEIEAQRDVLSAQADLAVTASDRRDIELKLLDLQYEEERIRLEAVLASKTATDAEKKIAQLRLDQLGTLKAADVQKVNNASLSPLQAYRKRLADESQDVTSSIQDAEVRALQSLEDSLTNSVKQALHLHGVFGDLIGDLIQIAIRQLVIKQIVDSINSSQGSGGSGGGGFFSKLLSLGSAVASGGGKSISNKAKASGGNVSAGELFRVNESGVEGFRPAQSGTIIPLGQMPKAIAQGSGDMGGKIQIVLQLSDDLDARIQRVSAPVSVEIARISAGETVKAAVTEMSRQFSRPRL